IMVQDDHGLPQPSSEWKAGETFVCGPHKVTIPKAELYNYIWVAGLYNSSSRMPLEGLRYDNGRYQLGALKVERNKTNDVTNVVFEPVSADMVEEAKASRLDFNNRVNPEGTMIDFGKIVTDGSVKVQKTAEGTIIFPYPRDKEFMVKLKTADLKLGDPSALKLVAKAALTQEDMGEVPVTVEGEYLVFKAGLKGAGRYLIEKKDNH
ncbi:MAG: hypothetical protein IJU61_11850, partial [Victivallales bacterium]|nr:hypothetical protein [Victivallales bacterium]